MAQGRATISTAAALLFQGGIGLVGWLAIWLFDIPLMLNGLNLPEILLYGILGAGTTYLVLLLLTQLSWLFPDDLGSQMQALYRFAASYRWPVLLTLCLLAGVGREDDDWCGHDCPARPSRGAHGGHSGRAPLPWSLRFLMRMLLGQFCHNAFNLLNGSLHQATPSLAFAGASEEVSVIREGEVDSFPAALLFRINRINALRNNHQQSLSFQACSSRCPGRSM